MWNIGNLEADIEMITIATVTHSVVMDGQEAIRLGTQGTVVEDNSETMVGGTTANAR